jgi:hypothetical protein
MDYDLYSNDWSNVVLMRAEHMRSETFYFEQMNRWGLQYGGAWGIVHIADEELQVFGSGTDYSVAVSGCKAVSRQGYIIDIGRNRPPVTLSKSNDAHTSSVVPIYLGVAVQKETANAGPSQTGALLDRPILRWKYVLDTDPSSPQFDWILIGRMKRDGQRFVRDDGFIPQCVHLRSYPAMIRISNEITAIARKALLALKQATRARSDGKNATIDWQALIGTFVTSLTPATVLLDWETHPRAYLERLLIAIQNYFVLLPLVQAANPNWQQAYDRVQRVMALLDTSGTPAPEGVLIATGNASAGLPVPTIPGQARVTAPLLAEDAAPTTYWWEAFAAVRDAFQALALLFQQLTPVSGPAPPPDDGDGEVYVMPVKRAGAPGR